MNLNELHKALPQQENWKELYLTELQKNQHLMKEKEAQEQKITRLSSEKQELKSLMLEQQNELQQKSGTIKSLNERIGNPYKADNILEENEALKQEMVKIKEEAESEISAARNKYYNLTNELAAREKYIQNAENNIMMSVAAKEKEIKREYQKKLKQKEVEITQEYDKKTNAHYLLRNACLIFSIITPLFLILKSEAIQNDAIAIYESIILRLFYAVYRACHITASKNLLSPEYETINLILYYCIYLFFFLLIAGILGITIFAMIKRLASYWNETSMAIMIISFSFFITFSDYIKSVTNVNIFLLILVVYLLYMAKFEYDRR